MKKIPPKKSLKTEPVPLKIHPVVPLLIILAATFLVFLPSLGNGLILWDDNSYTWENPFLKDFNFSKVFSFSTFYMGNYHPLTLLWLHGEWLAFPHGDPGTYGGVIPFWFHLNNIVLHLVNVLLVFCLVYELLDRKGWKTAAVTAALFAIHPMHVESVVWVSELKDVLYGAFFLGSAWSYVRYLKTGKLRLLVVALVLFILSNLAKAQAVTLPVLFFLFDYYQGRKLNIRLILEKVPFLVLAIFFGILAVKAQIVAKAISEQYPLSLSSALNACYGLMTYLFKLIVPVHLAALHPYVYKDISSFPWYFFILPLIFAVLVCLAFRSARQTKDWLFGFMFYLITVSVMIKLVPVSDSMLNERYTYIPYIGLFFIAGQLYSRFSQRQKWKGLASAAMIGILVALSVLTIQRSRTWKDNLTFWKDEIVKYPDYWRGYSSVGWHYYQSGDYDNALDYANRSCEIGVSALPYMLRGAIYLVKMKYPLAIEDFKKVISFHEPSSPLDLDVRYNLGISYDHNGNYLEAINILDESIRMAPDNPRGHVLKGMTLTHMKQYSGAETEYTKAIQISPGDVDTYMYRGLLYEDNLNRYDQAIGDFRKVLAIEPGRKDAKINIGISLYKKQAFAEAVQQYDLVLGLFPDDAEVYYLRALAYQGKGSLAEAYGDGLKARQLGYILSDRDLESLKIKK